MARMVHIGTSGWHYPHWEKGVFYPQGLARTKQLGFYAQHFRTVELNASFYHLPKPKAFQGWYEKTPGDFLFAVKASRYISHIKKLKESIEPWERFIAAAGELKDKLGPILFQLPPGWSVDPERLEDFLHILPAQYRYSFEFRHPSWLCQGVYDILRNHNVALCIADSPSFPKVEEVTAPFVYIRMHGSSSLYSSEYSDQEIANWAGKIGALLEHDLDVYVYFNNDAYGYAVQNARQLSQMFAHCR